MTFALAPALAPLTPVMQANPFGEAILNGSMLLAIPVAVLAGLVSFVSPCVLPLVPGYLGYVTGLSGVDLEKQRRGRMLLGIGLFVLGFTVVMVLLGAFFGQVAVWLQAGNQQWIMRALGVVVIVMGIVFLGGFSFFQRDRRIEARPPAGLWGAPLLGVIFGLSWAPCIGPTFAAIQLLVLSDSEGSALKGAFLTLFYCLGLGLPFLLIALGVRRGMGAMKFFKKHRVLIQRIGGGMLIVLGLLMVFGVWQAWIANLQGLLTTVTLPV